MRITGIAALPPDPPVATGKRVVQASEKECKDWTSFCTGLCAEQGTAGRATIRSAVQIVAFRYTTCRDEPNAATVRCMAGRDRVKCDIRVNSVSESWKETSPSSNFEDEMHRRLVCWSD